jgi:hypothetical protein
LAAAALFLVLAAGCVGRGAMDRPYLLREDQPFFLRAVWLPPEVPPVPATDAFHRFADAARAGGFNAVALEAAAPTGAVPLAALDAALRSRRMVALVVVAAPEGPAAEHQLAAWAGVAEQHRALTFWFRGPAAATAVARFRELSPGTAVFAPPGVSADALPLALELPRNANRHFVVPAPDQLRGRS